MVYFVLKGTQSSRLSTQIGLSQTKYIYIYHGCYSGSGSGSAIQSYKQTTPTIRLVKSFEGIISEPSGFFFVARGFKNSFTRLTRLDCIWQGREEKRKGFVTHTNCFGADLAID